MHSLPAATTGLPRRSDVLLYKKLAERGYQLEPRCVSPSVYADNMSRQEMAILRPAAIRDSCDNASRVTHTAGFHGSSQVGVLAKYPTIQPDRVPADILSYILRRVNDAPSVSSGADGDAE